MLGLPPKPWSRRRHRPIALVVVLIVLGGPAALASDSGRSLADVLRGLQDEGVDVNFSTALVPDELRVDRLPPGDGETFLRALLAPFGLSIESPTAGRWWVIPAPRQLSGRVVERSSGHPLDRAVVRLGELATTTDAGGRFRLTIDGVEPGELTIERPGFRRVRTRLSAEEPIEDLEIALVATVDEVIDIFEHDALGSIRWTDGRKPFDATEPLDDLDDWQGVDTRGDRLSIRGDREGRLAVVLDGHEVHEPYHLRDFGALVGLVPPVAVAGTRLHREWLPPAIAERSDAVLELVGREPAPGALHGHLGIDESTTQTAIGGTAFGDRAGWFATYRRGRPILADELAESDEDPSFSDAFARLSMALSPSREIVLRGLWATDDFDFFESLGGFGSDQFDIDLEHVDVWGHLSTTSDRRLSRWSASHSRVQRGRFGVLIEPESSDDGYALNDRRVQEQLGLRHEVSVLSGDTEWSGGAEARDVRATLHYEDLVSLFRPFGEVLPETTTLSRDVQGVRSSVFIQRHQRVEAGARVVGLRVDRTALTGEWTISPRWSETRRLGGGRLHWAAGIYHRPMRPIEVAIADRDPSLKRAERTSRASLGYTRRWDSGLEIGLGLHADRVDNPWPRYENLYEPVSRFPEVEDDRIRLLPTRGQVVGLELSLRHRGRTTSSALVYRLAEASDRLADGRSLPRDIDRRHQLSIDWQWRPAPGWAVSATWSGATGRPDTPYRIELDPEPRWIPGDLYSTRLPASHRLDVEVRRDHRWRGLDLSWRLGVDNLYDHETVRGYDTTPVLDADGVWRLPPELGLGLTPRAGLSIRF